MQPKVSVIVPVYKAEKYIERCCRSLFNQTLDCIEYIFINDCTPDNSMNILQNTAIEYPNRLPYIHIINHKRNTGQSEARRDGMAIATGAYIIHCDADDWVDIDMYEKMYLKALETGAEAICCDMMMEYSNFSSTLTYCNKYEDHKLMYDCIVPISVVYCSMCNRLVSRKLFERENIEPYSGVNMWDDVGLTTRIRFHVKNSYVISFPYYHYNRENESSTTRRPRLDRINEQIKCAEKLEQFFINKHSKEKYKYFITQLKYKAKEDLLDFNYQLWKKTFPEVNNKLWHMRRCISIKQIIKYFILNYGGLWGYNIFKFYKKKKSKGLNKV